jgi:hypothetical protein
MACVQVEQHLQFFFHLLAIKRLQNYFPRGLSEAGKP